MSNAPLMPKATAVWLLDNTALSFDQVADFCKMHPLEIQATAERRPFSQERLFHLLALAHEGLSRLREIQDLALEPHWSDIDRGSF